MFKRTALKKLCEQLTREKDQLVKDLENAKCENRALNDRMQDMLAGNPFEGGYCKGCKNHIPDFVCQHSEGHITGIVEMSHCALRVPCPEFEREKG